MMSAKEGAQAALKVAASQGAVISPIDARLIAITVGQYDGEDCDAIKRAIRYPLTGYCDIMAHLSRLDGEQMTMNAFTGSVDTCANWLVAMPTTRSCSTTN